MKQQTWYFCAFAVFGLTCTLITTGWCQEAAPPATNTETDPAAPVAAGSPSTAPTQQSLSVYPERIELSTIHDHQKIIGQVQWSNGLTQDVTAELQLSVGNPELVDLVGNRLKGKVDGETVVQVRYGSFAAEIPLVVRNAQLDPPISFTNDVMPVFSKAGCNTGSCHGAARGKDGFRLSLYGFDPAGDHYRLTREFVGRRVDLATPENCLLINKATAAVPHTGGGLISANDEYYQTLLRWLEAGSPVDTGPVPPVVKVVLYPEGGVLDGADTSQQLNVVAHYEDGSTRDVTSLAYFMTSNDNSASVSQTGMVTAKNRGQAFIMARFDTHTVGRHFIVLPQGLEFQWPNPPAANYIDTLVHDQLQKLRMIPSDLCSDEEFIRRVCLDICGVVPTADEVRTFIASTDPAKRSVLIDQLLDRKEFVETWVMKWSELLQVRSSPQVSYKATLLYYNWLQQQIAANVPIDQMVREILGAEGGTFTNAATNYYQNEQDTLKVAENVAQVFLGTRIQCAQCHNHPFDRWTMSDYYQFAAFFSQIGRKPGTDPREQIVFDSRGGEVQHPVTKAAMKPRFLGGDFPDTNGRDRRKVVAAWLASRDNVMFRDNLANLVWAHFFGRGIVHEVDDVRVSNPPANPQLLSKLGLQFAEYGFDFKKLVRDICNSHTYQRSTQTNPTNEADHENFAHAELRRVRAEVLLDVISQITETENKFRGLPLGARAVQIADGNTSSYFLTTFGRATRETVCSCEVKMEPNLSQALHLINGDTVHQNIKQGKVIQRLLDAGRTAPEIIEEIYLRALARRPTPIELESLTAAIKEEADQTKALEDIFWAVLNSREFVFNH